LRSEQTLSVSKGNGSSSQGIPGVTSNQSGASGDNLAGSDSKGDGLVKPKNQNSRSQSTRNFEIDRTISHSSKLAGRVLRLSVGVVLDDKVTFSKKGKPTETPLTDQELEQYSNLIKNAIGFDAKRGDTVTVINSSFADVAPITEVPDSPFYAQAWFPSVVKQGAAALFILVLIFVVLKPILKSLTSISSFQNAQKLKEAKNRSDSSGSGGGSNNNNLLGNDQQYELSAVKDLVIEDPKRVAQVVKNWVGDDSE